MSTEYLANKFTEALIYFAPAMICNAAPVLTRVFRYRHPIDGGRVLRDGRRVFGDGKTWEGLIAGLLAGLLTGVAYTLIFNTASCIMYALIMSVGALLGDLINAFIKRRVGLKQGSPFPPLDQVDYLLGSYVSIKSLNIDLIMGVELTLEHLVLAMLISLILHPLTNFMAYMLGFKEVPW